MGSRPVRGLRGERVYLRPLEPTDVELVHSWYEDVRVSTLMGDLPISLAARKHRYEESSRAAETDVFRFVICLLDDDRRVGRTDLFDLDRQNGSCAFGITLGEPEMWGQGLGTDAVNALVDFAFGQLRVERVWLDTDADNERAQAAYTKAGFTHEGRFRHAFYQDGHWSDDLRMAMLRDEWEVLPRPRSWDLAAREVQA